MSEHKPLISVVMSVYNGASYLKEAIESVLNQTYPHFEFLIINDGSIDQSLEIIQSFKDDRIRLLDNEVNKGLIYSLNRGLDEAKGKYIARMDADDISLPHRFEKQVSFLERHSNVGVLGSDYISFSEDASQYIVAIHNSAEIKSFLLFSATICHPTLMLRKSIIDQHHFRYSETTKHVEDFDLWTRMSVHKSFSNLNEALLKYRDHANLVSHTFSEIQKQNGKLVRQRYLGDIGFSYSEPELNVHNLIASNQRITSKEQILNIENWLTSLVKQNDAKQVIPAKDFNHVMAKQWLDCCGNTKLGLWAYFKFQKSELKHHLKQSSLLHLKLFAKCLIRWIR